ncbi:MAG: hypothetical protein WCW47_02275 [Candidatus Paceibacterota bacterium]|jgi:DUF1680 family protein
MKNKLIKMRAQILYKLKKFLVTFNYPEFRSLPNKPRSDEEHLKAAMEWLCLAQDVTGCGGVSTSYDLASKKWGNPYRETTGYIIETFVDYYKLTGDKNYLERAEKMANWEIDVMSTDGAVGEIHKDGILYNKVFNTGQVILGFYKLFLETKEERYLKTMQKSADWLILNQNESGAWEKFSTKGAKTVDSRVAWSLLEVYVITKDERYRICAEKHLEWVLKQQKENFWFDKTSFTSSRNAPWTHMIAYTISGILESYKLGQKKDNLYKSFYGAADKMLECFYKTKTSSGFLPSTFDEDWESEDDYSCLTGDVQLAAIWMEIWKMTNEKRFLDGAFKIIKQVKSTQILDTKEEIRGGILGSYPYYGEYSHFLLINWATKFFADALILKIKVGNESRTKSM